MTYFLLMLWIKKKFLRKLAVWIVQEHVKNQICPQKLSKKMPTLFPEVLHLLFNVSVSEGHFQSVFKLANFTPIFIKSSKNSKDNYRPISILKVKSIWKKYVQADC